MGGERKKNMEKITKLIWVLPILFGPLGGILMYIAVKDQNQGMANEAIFWSVIVTIGLVIISGVVGIAYYITIMPEDLQSAECTEILTEQNILKKMISSSKGMSLLAIDSKITVLQNEYDIKC